MALTDFTICSHLMIRVNLNFIVNVLTKSTIKIFSGKNMAKIDIAAKSQATTMIHSSVKSQILFKLNLHLQQHQQQEHRTFKLAQTEQLQPFFHLLFTLSTLCQNKNPNPFLTSYSPLTLHRSQLPAASKHH